MSDLENGLWACGTPRTVNPAVFAVNYTYVTAMVKGGDNVWALKTGDAAAGPLIKTFEGARPPGYHPMRKEGSIILGIGGDNSNSAVGTFLEGALTAGYTSDATDDALQADLVAAGWGK